MSVSEQKTETNRELLGPMRSSFLARDWRHDNIKYLKHFNYLEKSLVWFLLPATRKAAGEEGS